jgi:hypothetical protein
MTTRSVWQRFIKPIPLFRRRSVLSRFRPFARQPAKSADKLQEALTHFPLLEEVYGRYGDFASAPKDELLKALVDSAPSFDEGLRMVKGSSVQEIGEWLMDMARLRLVVSQPTESARGPFPLYFGHSLCSKGITSHLRSFDVGS